MNGYAIAAAPVAGAANATLAPVRPAQAIAERSAQVPREDRLSRAAKP
jgi:hypothetical protein